ncbi:cohesin domain-containing protein, partial [Aquincola sp. MAHUQ-54]
MLNGAGFKGRIAAAMLAAITMAPAAWSQTTLSTTVTPAPAVVGSTVTVDVRIDNVLDLYGFQFTLGFDSSVLRANTVGAGSFLSTGGSTFFGPGSIDNDAGSVAFIFDTLLDDVPGVNGGGTLASISFDVLRAGSSALNFSDVMLS